MATSSHTRTAPGRDDGFTLVEVLVVISVLALIAIVVSASIIVVFRSEDGAIRQVAESHDTQQGVNFFPLDIHAGPVDQAAYDTSTTATGCSATAPAGSTNVLQFEKGDKRVAYRLTVVGDQGRLDRQICDFPGFANTSQVNIADRLDGLAPQPAAATLFPAAGVFVESIELRLVQNQTDSLVVASPRAEPRNSPGDCQTNNPIAAAHGYGTYIEGDVELQEGQVSGWVGLGGTLTWLNDITIAYNNMSGVAPIYGLYAEGIDWGAIIRGGAQGITDLAVVSNTATATLPGHGYSTGDLVIVEGTGDTDIDAGAYTISVTGADSFTFSTVAGDVTNLKGTARTADPLTDLDVVANVATATVIGHGYTAGQQVAIEGTGNIDIDGDAYVVTAVIDADTFTFTVVTPNVNNLSGTSRFVEPMVLEVAREKAAIGGTPPAFVKIGDFVYEATGSLDNYIDISGPANPDAEPTAGQLDFPIDFDELRDCSAQLAQLLDICALDNCANEADVTVTPAPPPSPGTVNACASNNVPQVLNVPEQYFDGTWEFDTSGPGCQGFSQVRPLILNVIDDGDGIVEFDATPVDWTALGDRKNILFNFPNATVVNINNGFWGHVLAPFAHVTTYGNLDGGIIAREWTHVDGTVTSDDDIFDNSIPWP